MSLNCVMFSDGSQIFQKSLQCRTIQPKINHSLKSFMWGSRAESAGMEGSFASPTFWDLASPFLVSDCRFFGAILGLDPKAATCHVRKLRSNGRCRNFGKGN